MAMFKCHSEFRQTETAEGSGLETRLLQAGHSPPVLWRRVEGSPGGNKLLILHGSQHTLRLTALQSRLSWCRSGLLTTIGEESWRTGPGMAWWG